MKVTHSTSAVGVTISCLL